MVKRRYKRNIENRNFGKFRKIRLFCTKVKVHVLYSSFAVSFFFIKGIYILPHRIFSTHKAQVQSDPGHQGVQICNNVVDFSHFAFLKLLFTCWFFFLQSTSIVWTLNFIFRGGESQICNLSECFKSAKTNKLVLAGMSLRCSFFFFLSLKAMSQLTILCRLASVLVCISKPVSPSVSYLRAAIL